MSNMEMISAVLSTVVFAVVLVVGGLCFFKGVYYFIKALANRNTEVTRSNYFTSFNFTNALWVSDALTPKGKQYRAKAIKNIGSFCCLVIVLAVVNNYVH